MPFKLAIVMLLGMSVHAHASILLTAGPNEGAGPQTWVHAEVRLNPSGQVLSRISAVYQADRYGLRAEADVINDLWDPHPGPLAAIRVDDVVVNATPGTNPPPGTTTTVRFGGNLEGGLTGTGSGSVILNLVVPGKTNRSVVFNSDEFPVSGFFQTSPFTVTIGQPFTVEASLRIKAGALPGHVTVDFGDSFTFDPSSVLTLEPGFTASSASWGLVDNSLPVPEPCGLVLLGTAPVAWFVRRRPRPGSSGGATRCGELCLTISGGLSSILSGTA